MEFSNFTFVWTGEGDNVFLAGSFNNWQRIPLEKIKDGLFYATLKVPKERILYKFIVDGNWKHAPDSKIDIDQSGILNNVLLPEDMNNSSSSDFLSDSVSTFSEKHENFYDTESEIENGNESDNFSEIPNIDEGSDSEIDDNDFIDASSLSDGIISEKKSIAFSTTMVDPMSPGFSLVECSDITDSELRSDNDEPFQIGYNDLKDNIVNDKLKQKEVLVELPESSAGTSTSSNGKMNTSGGIFDKIKTYLF